MAEEKKTKAPAKAAVKKAPAAKATAPKKAEKKAAGKTITVRQIGSPIGRPDKQLATLKGLGLNKLHRTRTLEDTAAVRGMVRSIPHLVEIVEDAA